jgi:hypothetical protein
MDIAFNNVRNGRARLLEEDLTFSKSEAVRGELEIRFETKGEEPYRRADINVPLAVAETKIFLAELEMHGRATWRLTFAPFLDAKVENGSVRLMEGSKDGLTGRTVEVLSPQSLTRLMKKLNQFERLYGRLPLSPDTQ